VSICALLTDKLFNFMAAYVAIILSIVVYVHAAINTFKVVHSIII
jgi:hypothetical protein